MTSAHHKLLRYSLVIVWLATAVASVWELHGQSRELLADLSAAWMAPTWKPSAIILAGATADALLGLWLWWRPGRTAYMAALAMMAVMTLLATAIHPAWWLHPLGPLTKNLPLAAILLVLLQQPQQKKAA